MVYLNKFFDYKYSIPGYNGQDFDGPARFVYMIMSIVLIAILVTFFRRAKKETCIVLLRVFSLIFIGIYLLKTIWESYYDIVIGGGFNICLLPFDTCSIVMWSALLGGFGKGKWGEIGRAWTAIGGIIGGTSNILFLQALKYYPFFSFGAFYSMFWHFTMAFLGVLSFVTNTVEANFKTIMYAFAFHLAISIIVIPLDYILDLDFMLYVRAGGIPGLEILGDALFNAKLPWLMTIIMLAVYFGAFALVTYATKGIKFLTHRCNPRLKKAVE